MNAVLEAPKPPALPDRLYDSDDLAELFGVVRYTILKWAKEGTIPPGRRFGRVLRWTPDDIAPLLANQGD
jgi:predicted DNA-binding transcriptional regulator AlpA